MKQKKKRHDLHSSLYKRAAMAYVDDTNEIENEYMQQFRISEQRDPDVCKEFGCGKHLTLEESRFGERCAEHSARLIIDIVKVIKFE